MSLTDCFKHMVPEDEPTPPVKVTMVPVPDVPAMVFTPGAGQGIAMAFSASPISGDFVVTLNKKMEAPGGSVDKFEKTLAALSFIPDEAMRLTATLSVLNIAGVNTAMILREYDLQLQVLDREVAKFVSAIANQQKSELGDQKAKLNEIEAQIQSLQSQRTVLFNAVKEATERFNRSQVGFNNAAEAMREKISAAVARLKGTV